MFRKPVPATLEHLEANLNRGRRAHWWRREGTKEQGFKFYDEHGVPISKSATERLKHLAIPPAWTHVRIAPSAGSRLQALGVDGSGRLQYLYHPKFRQAQDRHKFERIEHFGELLPRMRHLTNEDLTRPGLGKEKVLAVIVRLISRLYFRPGSEEGVERYQTFGITTLRKRHLKIGKDGSVRFAFHGKHHVHHTRVIVDAALANILRELVALPGTHLFQYRAEDESIHEIHGREVNDYVKHVTGPEYSAKDFRTWHGTLLVAQELAKLGPAETKTARKKNLVHAVKSAAAQLGNTPAVCKRSYLHPLIVSLYEKGWTLVDVPLAPGPIHTLQGPVPEEMQLLELFHVGRVLRQKDKDGRSAQVIRPAGAGPLAVAPPRWDEPTETPNS